VVNTRVKICGITRPEDGRAAAACGADAIGLVFYDGSPRAVTIEQAAEIARAVPPFVTVVALFVDKPIGEIERILAEVPVDLLQFHGDESPAVCRAFNRPWIKALRVRPGEDLQAQCEAYRGARAVLLDSWQEGVPGGTGKTFDWSLAEGALPLPVILAGGLNADNVGRAMAQLRPAAVDVSGGVEASRGIKDRARIEQFVAAVRAADRTFEGTFHDE
jgi:phosphoribosylanthranilate isomerase